jgi:hypothetical protein
MKCEPATVTSVWFGHVRQNSRIAPVSIALGSAFTNSFEIWLDANYCE